MNPSVNLLKLRTLTLENQIPKYLVHSVQRAAVCVFIGKLRRQQEGFARIMQYSSSEAGTEPSSPSLQPSVLFWRMQMSAPPQRFGFQCCSPTWELCDFGTFLNISEPQFAYW